ncbi:MAG: hypothetical protein EPN43_07160, partial [Jatrophihabitans sp.]
MFTAAAARSLALPDDLTVAGVAELAALGWTPDRIRNQVNAHRWQRIGRAVILHNHEPDRADLEAAALAVLGPRAALTSF